MAKKDNKTQIKSVLNSTLMYNGLMIAPGEIVEIDSSIAEALVEKKFCVEIKVKEM